MFETSDSTATLDEALAKAQGSIEIAKKDAINPHFKSKYADLAEVWRACRKALSENGVNVTQWPVHSEDGRVHMITRLAHKGEWMRAHFSVPVQQQNAQGYASGITYVKRMALSAAVGVAADDDDDGNEASKPKPVQQRRADPNPRTDPSPFDDSEPHSAPPTAPVNLPHLLAMGEEAADRGPNVLKTWWTGRSKDERKAIGETRINEWKVRAAASEGVMA